MIVAALLLMLAALACVAAEVFLPTHGVLAVFGVLAALAGIVLAFKVNAGLGMIFALVTLMATPVVFYWTVKIYPKTPVGKRVILSGPGETADDAFERESARLAGLVGRRGRAATMLRPAGSVEIEGRRVDCLSEADVIDAGAEVEVMRVAGLKVFVKRVEG